MWYESNLKTVAHTACVVLGIMAMSLTTHAAPVVHTLAPEPDQSTPLNQTRQPAQPTHNLQHTSCKAEAKRAQLAYTACLRAQLSPWLTKDQDAWTRYHAQKAYSWLAMVDHEQHEKGITRAGQFALQDAQRIVTALSTHQPLRKFTSVHETSGVLRPDLWITAERLKKHPRFGLVAEQVAQSEVKLVWATGEYCELGWRHAREHFNAAERWLGQAKAKVTTSVKPHWSQSDDLQSLQAVANRVGCGKPVLWPIAVADFVQPVKPKPVTPLQPILKIPAIQVPNNVHFAVNRADLSYKSRAVLDTIAAVLNQHRDIDVTLYGYTDARASIAYNQKLSARRTEAVEHYLRDAGIAQARIARIAKGENNLIHDTNPRMGHAKSRRVELRFASLGKEIQSEAQLADLQLEK